MKPSGIGGQAVIEGVMMRNGGKYAVAVRTQDGEIAVDVQNCSSEKLQNNKFVKLPIIRGVVNFFDSMILGMKALMFSASLFAEETEEERVEREGKARKKAEAKAEKLRAHGKEAEAQAVLAKCEEKLAKEAGQAAASDTDKKDDDWMMIVTVIFSIGFSVLLFMMLPYFISDLLRKVVTSEILILTMEGLVKMLIFFGYLIVISKMKDIQRTFMYHGAEHKCISCIENGMELTVENVRKCSREHKRCGTSFLFIVMFVSIIFIMVVSIPLFEMTQIDSKLARVGLRLVLLPLIAGVSYEFIRLAGMSDNKIVNLLSKPGMMMQRITTTEPDDSMIEVAIKSVEAVFDWKKFENEKFGTNYVLDEEKDA